MTKKGSEGMGTTWDVQVRVAKGIIIFNLIVIAIGTILLKDWKPFVIGNICGSIVAIVNFRLLAISMERLITMKSDKAGKHVRSGALIRLLINGVIIYVSLTSKHINAIGTVIGLLSIKPIILIEGLLHK